MNPVTRFESLLKSRKYGHLTKELYELLYIHSNQFIAHFDRKGFYEARIKDDDGFNNTIHLMAIAKRKEPTTLQNKYVNAMIAVAKRFNRKGA